MPSSLSDFIRQNKGRIIDDWATFARTLLPGSRSMTTEELRDHGEEVLTAVATDMDSRQSEAERDDKSKGDGPENSMGHASIDHARLRIEAGFTLPQMMSEYRALRASVVKLWSAELPPDSYVWIDDVTRFNEAIDQALTEGIDSYTASVTETRDRFLDILGHDLKNPLGAIVMSANFLASAEELPSKLSKAAERMLSSAARMSRMVDDLLDLTRARLGPGIPIERAPADLSDICKQVLGELESFHPKARLSFDVAGDVRGAWDAERLAQVVSNLVANAIEHGAEGEPVEVLVRGEAEEVVLTVRNQGTPIPRTLLPTIFEPGAQRARSARGLGLGLFVVQQVVTAHRGSAEIVSSKEEGTTITVRLPRAGVHEAELAGAATH
jgi:signal transduction histidine kinase